MAYLHAAAGTGSAFLAFADEVLLHSVLDTLKLIPFLFITYLLMEFIEHRAGDGILSFVSRAGKLGPLLGSALGVIPQCGFSAAAASLYTGRVITVGTLIAVFLSTSDEMIPILLAGSISPKSVLIIVVYKLLVATVIGFGADITLSLFGRSKEKVNIDEICERDNCHCERGIVHSALHHTSTITVFIFAVTVAIGSLDFFIGAERLAEIISPYPILSHAICAVIGLIPSCASSVALSTLYVDGIISAGAMVSGLFPAAGVGLIVLLRINKHPKENALIISSLILLGIAFGLIFDLMPLGL